VLYSAKKYFSIKKYFWSIDEVHNFFAVIYALLPIIFTHIHFFIDFVYFFNDGTV